MAQQLQPPSSTKAAYFKHRSTARQAFEDCPLIEIVHFHDCLRGELRSLRANVDTLCSQMRALPQLSSSSSSSSSSPSPSPPPSTESTVPSLPPQTKEPLDTPAAPSPISTPEASAEASAPAESATGNGVDTGAATVDDGCGDMRDVSGNAGRSGGHVGSMQATSEGAAAVVSPLPSEHVKLEVQINSQFQLLWAVFQSHSTAEDEMIWPALKEKARSTGGKLKLVNQDDDSRAISDAPRSAEPLSSSSPSSHPMDTATVSGKSALHQSTGDGEARNGAEPIEEQGERSRGRGSEAAGTLGVPVTTDVATDGGGGGEFEGNVGGANGEYGGAMIDEQEYAEEHHEEQRLFESMQELLTRLRNTRQNLQDRLKVIAGLGSKTDEMCRHLMTHLDKEEEGALPLIKHYFTSQEMQALVGKIMGKRPTELMQTILAMMIKNLPPDEVWTVLGYMRRAVKDTYFEKWLAAGGFQWPTNSKSDGRTGARGGPQGAGNTGAEPHAPGGLGDVCEHVSSVSLLCGMHTKQSAASRRPNGSNERPGEPMRVDGEDGGGQGAEDCGTAARCPLEQRFEGIRIDGGSAVSSAAAAMRDRNGGNTSTTTEAAEGVGAAAGEGIETSSSKPLNTCSVCNYIGRCPVDEPLSQQEFEVAVKRLSHVAGLSMGRKSQLVQALRNHMYQVRKRARPGGEENERPCSTRDGVGAAAAGRREAAWTPPTAPSGRDASRRGDGSSGVERGQGLMPPARYYTSTQPDIEDSGGGGCGAIGWPAVVEGGGSGEGRIGRGPMPPPLFTREELAPTYHIVGGASTPSGGAAANGQAGADGGGGVNGAAEAAAGGGAAVLGCPHYRRACKMRAPCCQKLFTCRLCHDQASDHTVDRGEVKEMLCMRCGTLQPMHSECRNPSCRPLPSERSTSGSRRLARYYCGICHLFDDAPEKDIYHCPYCNVCRLGKGLGVDFFHCMTCNACISSSETDHTCLSKSLESDCPICSSSMFTSTAQVKRLNCGHFMHLHCYKEYIRRAESREFWYRCPVCRKSMEDMREYFSQMDAVVASQPMPEEYSSWKAKVLCHDCDKHTEVSYHFFYLKCGACGSYNTRTEGQTPRLEQGASSTVAELPRQPMEDDSDRSAPPGP